MLFTLKIMSLVSATGAAGTGFKAAYEWFKSSKVEIKSNVHTRLGGGAMAAATTPLVAGTMDAFRAASSLNMKASAWTAVSVALTAISSVVSTIVAFYS